MASKKKHAKKRSRSKPSLKARKHQYPFWILEAIAGGLLILGYMLSLSPFHKKLAVVVFFAAWVLAGLGVAVKLWREFSEPVTASLNVRQTERPRIWLKHAVARLENLDAPKDTPIVELVFENTGPADAFEVNPSAHAYIASQKLRELPAVPAEEEQRTVIPGAFLPANRELTHVIGSPEVSDSELKEKIERGEVFMYVFGVVTYASKSHGPVRYTTNFCGLYMPHQNNFQQQPFGNETE